LALFRALQEALSNVLRHADARTVHISLAVAGDRVVLDVRDDGRGPPGATPGQSGHMGLTGMRERISALGGSVRFDRRAGGGAMLEVAVPVTPAGRA
jgi:signal transduction histidine kinase